MSKEVHFGKGMEGFGRIVLQEVIKTDYGPGASFDGISGHGPDTHNETHALHEQVNLFKSGVSGSGLKIRFLND